LTISIKQKQHTIKKILHHLDNFRHSLKFPSLFGVGYGDEGHHWPGFHLWWSMMSDLASIGQLPRDHELAIL
jgi:hypothetical protein